MRRRTTTILPVGSSGGLENNSNNNNNITCRIIWIGEEQGDIVGRSTADRGAGGAYHKTLACREVEGGRGRGGGKGGGVMWEGRWSVLVRTG